MLKIKRDALDAAERERLFTNIVVTVEAGVNDSELGEILSYALQRPNVCGLVLQPVMDNGRYLAGYDPRERMTLTGAIAGLCTQSGGRLRPTDFVGLPCSHPDCAALTYCFLNKERTASTPLPRHLDVSQYLDLFADRISFSGMLGSIADRLWNDIRGGAGLSSLKEACTILALPDVRAMLPVLRDNEQVGRRVFRIVIKPFMDATPTTWHVSTSAALK